MSRKPRGCRYKLVGIMGSGVDIVVLGVAICVLVLNACVLSVDISALVYNRILAVDIAVLRKQNKGRSTGNPEYAGERRDDRGRLGMRGRTLV